MSSSQVRVQIAAVQWPWQQHSVTSNDARERVFQIQYDHDKYRCNEERLQRLLKEMKGGKITGEEVSSLLKDILECIPSSVYYVGISHHSKTVTAIFVSAMCAEHRSLILEVLQKFLARVWDGMPEDERLIKFLDVV